MSLSTSDRISRQEPDSENFQLKKKIGIWSAIALLAGTIVGSGIFVSPVGVLEGTNGNVGLSLVLWAVCGLLSLLAALCYAELGTMIPESGADFAYHRVAYGRPIGFLYAWTSILVVRTTGNAAMAITFGTYLTKPFTNCDPPPAPTKCAAIVLLMCLTWINYVSVKASAVVQNIFTAAKFLAMVIIVVGGMVRLAQGDPVGKENFSNAFDSHGQQLSFTMIGLALYQGLFSYDGWNNLNYITEEMKKSHKTLPRAILVAVPLVTAFYVLVNVAYLSVLTPAELVNSQAVAVTFGNRVLGSFAWIMPLTVCLSTAGSLNGSYLSGGRMPFVASRYGQWPQIFEMVHVTYYTPAPSMILNTALTILFLIPSDFDMMLYAFSFTAWTFYGLSAFAVILLRFTRPKLERPFKVPIPIPIVVTVASLYLIIAPLVDAQNLLFLYALIFMLAAFVVYYPFVYKRWRIPGIDAFTKLSQLTLNVAPTNWEEIIW